MLRLLVLVLVLANAGYFAWSQGFLTAYGLGPALQAEPHRLTQQIQPEAMRLLPPGSSPVSDLPAANLPAPTAAALPPAATQCLQVGLFSDAQVGVLRTRLQASLPPNSWTFEDQLITNRWIIYMGKYVDEEVLAKKRAELRQRSVAFEQVLNPLLQPGLSLGHFALQADAESELAKIAVRGVRTARVVLERPEVRGQMLKVPAATATQKTQLEALKPQLAGKALQACR